MDATQRLRITEIFHSIQGESTWAGRPCLFVRLTGCNLRCTWCDSEYTFQGGEWRTLAEIFDQLASFPACDLVEVTGGEPMLQKEVIPLMQGLIDRGYTVLLETGGSLDLSEVPEPVRRIIDLKAPGSGEVARNLWENMKDLRPWDEVKVVIASREDYEWAIEAVHEYRLLERVPVLFSPVFGRLQPVELAQWILADGLPIRMQLQMHKFIWPPDTRGV
jgi:7-carboxy-7-deazaguanine synthase